MLKKIQIFIRNYTKQIIAMSVFFMAIFSFFLLSSFALETPLKSIIITSKNTSFESKEVGSWQVKKVVNGLVKVELELFLMWILL